MGKGIIVGVVGKARVGKDTFAEMLAEALFDLTQQKFIMMAYATELKLRVQRDFDLSYDQLWGDQKEVEDKRYLKPRATRPYRAGNRDDGRGLEALENFWTAREILQSYGQFYRTIDGEFWVKNLFRVIDDKEYKNVIVTDVRHPNEADPIKAREGYVIRVTSDRKDKEEIHGAQHISETAMDSYLVDFTVRNDEGLKELRSVAEGVADFIIQNEKLKYLEV